ncbi:MAG: hypothetical protein LBL42_02010 [Tannerella sp.]|jgi:hypothetical protein|nr:hypothetical protein [Tannerella sp.]
MDNHIGDWLYYIVIIVVAVVSFAGNLKKKKPQEETLSPAPSMEDLEDMLPPAPPVQAQRRKSPPPAPRFRPSRSSFLSPPAEEGSRMLTDDMPVVTGEKRTAWVDELNLTDTDTFRKAFISAEILNRKY